MPLGKLAAIAAAVVFASLAFALLVAFLRAERDANEFLVSPAAAPLAVPAKASAKAPVSTVATGTAETAKPAAAAPAAAEPKAPEPRAIAAPAPEKPKTQASSPKPAPVPVRSTGGDRDCTDFDSHEEAQRFFLANGGPASDPHKLDRDRDGLACENN